MCQPTVQELITRYREAAAESSSSMRTTDPQRANRAHDRLHEAYKLLKQTAEGREAIVGLLVHPDPEVRCCAAAHSLQWKPREARAVLEQLARRDDVLGFEALMILKEFDAGRLSFDY